jgi:hypothetical protein
MATQPTGVFQTPAARDQANAVVSGVFADTGVSETFVPWGPFNIFIYGDGGPNGNWNASVRLERTFDGGTTWVVCGIGGDGTQAVWATNNSDVSVVAGEPEKGMGYRLNCTVHTSGNVNYRLSATGAAALSLAIASSI